MAIVSSFFSCFSGSNKVVDEGNNKINAAKESHKVDGDQKVKNKSRKSAPIPVAYFPVGSNFSRL